VVNSAGRSILRRPIRHEPDVPAYHELGWDRYELGESFVDDQGGRRKKTEPDSASFRRSSLPRISSPRLSVWFLLITDSYW